MKCHWGFTSYDCSDFLLLGKRILARIKRIAYDGDVCFNPAPRALRVLGDSAVKITLFFSAYKETSWKWVALLVTDHICRNNLTHEPYQ